MRKELVKFVAVLLLPAASAMSADIEVSSTIDGVTVFPVGAEIERITRLHLESGSHTLIFRDLPRTADARSIRVEGKATGPLDIGSVDTRIVEVPSIDPASAESARRKLEEDIEKLEDERQTYQSEIEVAEAQKQFAANLTKLPTHGYAGAAAGQPAREDWQQISALIASQVGTAEKAIHAARLKIRTVERKLDDLRKRLAAEAPKILQRTEVKVSVNAKAEMDADLVVRYQVRNAAWRPYYDARLATGSRTTAPSLTIARRGTITQTTGEPWKNVRLALSTTRPAAGTAAPILGSVTVDFEPERPASPRDRFRISGRTDAEALRSAQAPAAGVAAQPKLAEEALAPPPMQDATTTMSEAEMSTFQAVFRVQGRTTVAETGEAKRVSVDEATIEPQLKVQTVPRIDQRAFLYAKFDVPKIAPYLPGPVALFRDSTFIGNGRLPQLAPGEDHELGFGTDDAVRVRFAVVKESRGESGLISSQLTDERNFRITMKNLHERPISYAVVDHVPVSLNDDIRVETTMRPQPAKRELDDRRGVIAWEGSLTPGSEHNIELGYRIVWPAGKRIIHRR